MTEYQITIPKSVFDRLEANERLLHQLQSKLRNEEVLFFADDRMTVLTAVNPTDAIRSIAAQRDAAIKEMTDAQTALWGLQDKKIPVLNWPGTKVSDLK